MAYARKDKSLGELLSDFSYEVQDLVRKELLLARTEMTEKMGYWTRGLSLVTTGGAVLYAGLLTITGGITLLLSYLMPLWAAALAVGFLLSIIGYVISRRGRKRLKTLDLTPRQTIDTFREDEQWLKEQGKKAA